MWDSNLSSGTCGKSIGDLLEWEPSSQSTSAWGLPRFFMVCHGFSNQKKSGSMQLGRAIHQAHRGCPTDDQESSPVKRCFFKRKHHQILLWGFSCRFILHPMCVPSSRSEHKHFTKTVTSQRKTCVHSVLVEVPGPPRYPWVFIHTLQHHLEFLQMFFLGRNGTQLC